VNSCHRAARVSAYSRTYETQALKEALVASGLMQ
jgi:hypothetical protein